MIELTVLDLKNVFGGCDEHDDSEQVTREQLLREQWDPNVIAICPITGFVSSATHTIK